MSGNNDFLKGFILGQIVGFLKGVIVGFLFFKLAMPKILDFLEDYFYGDDYFDDDFEAEKSDEVPVN
ncbi:MAG: hypothetical protein PHW04_01120 [Candidatus Wallbacteria bacterium]|nr:hypothetical protein [Candidatus Wallbacteria bacterium]